MSSSWFHKNHPNKPYWAHLGFKKPIFLNLDMIERQPEATIYIFDNELLAYNFEEKLHRNGAQNEFIAAAWPGGKDTIGKVDFSPLRGRQVVRVEEKSDASITLTETMAPTIQAVTSNFTIKLAEEF